MLSSLMEIINGYILNVTTWLNTVSGGNQFLAGAMLVTITGVIAIVRKIPGKLYRVVKYRVMSSITLCSYSAGNIAHNTDAIRIQNFLRWYNSSKWFSLIRNSEVVDYYNLKEDNDVRQVPLYMSRGTFPFFYKWRLYFVTGTIIKEENTRSTEKSVTITISTFGLFSGKSLELVEEIKSLYINGDPAVTRLTANGGYFHLGNLSKNKVKQKLYQDDGSVELIRSKIEKFLASREYYKKFDIPYRESFMLHGVPGTGKTSIVRTLAKDYGLSICSQSVDEISSKFSNALLDASGGVQILLIEDIDSLRAAKKRNIDHVGYEGGSLDDKVPLDDSDDGEESEEDRLNNLIASLGQNVSNSSFLNSLDGILPVENYIFIFTTNCLSSIDDAILRKGRVNNIIEIKPIGIKGVNEFIKDRYGVEEHLTDESITIPICDLQYMFTSNMEDYEGFSKDLNEYVIKLKGEQV